MAKANNPDRGLKKYKDGQWGVDMTANGRPHRKKIGSKSDARAYYNELKRRERLGEVLPGRVEIPALADLLEQFSERAQHDHYKRYALQWARLFGRRPANSLDADFLQSVINELQKRRKPSTVRKMIGALRRCLRLAEQQDKIEPRWNPFNKKGLIRLPRENSRRHRILSQAEERRLEAAAGTWWPWIDFALQTAVRQEDQLGMLRTDPNLELGFVVLQEPKSGVAHQVPLNDRAREILQAQLRSHDHDLVFPSPTGKKWQRNNFRGRVWRTIFDAAGLSDFTWHDLRRSAASRLVRAGVKLYVVQRLLDHRDPRTTQRYAFLGDDALKRAVRVLDGSGGETLEQENVRLRAEVLRLTEENRRLTAALDRAGRFGGLSDH